jgi:ABC-2 type transport system permease protein
MIGSLAAAVRWDWFKLQRRWMPWILLAILLLFSQLGVWTALLRYQADRQSGGRVPIVGATGGPSGSVACSDLLAGKTSALPAGTSPVVVEGLQAQCRQAQAELQGRLAEEYQSMTLPGSIPTSAGLGVTVGLILIAVLAASYVGTEYGWGTLRTALVRGIGRWQFVASKLLLLALLAAAALLVLCVATAISSTAAGSIAPAPATTLAAPSWGHAAVILVKGWVALTAFSVLAVFTTVLTRSSAAGMAIAIGYYLAESITVSILSGLVSWLDTVAHYLFGANLVAWANLEFFGAGASSVTPLHAFLVLLVYAVVLAALSFWIFERRDVTGSSSS